MKKNGYRDLFIILGKYKFLYTLIFINFVIVAILDVIPVFLIREIADKPDDFTYFGLLFMLVGFFKVLFSISHQYIYPLVSMKLIQDYLSLLLNRIMGGNWHQINKLNIGEVFSVFQEDVKDVAAKSSYILTSVMLDILKAVFYMATIIYLNKLFALLSLCLMPIMFFSSKFFSKKVYNATNNVRKNHVEISKTQGDIINGLKYIKANNFQLYKSDEYTEKSKLFIKAVSNSHLIKSFLSNIPSFFNHLLIGIVFIYGGYQYVNNQITIGVILASYTALMQLYQPINNIFSMSINVDEINVSQNRINELLLKVEPEEENKTAVKENLTKIESIEIKNLTFSFQEREIFHNLNMSIKQPGLYALIGESGVGKSTMIDILTKFYTDYDGEIIYNKMSLRDITAEEVRKKIAVILQEPFLFNISIMENLRLHSNGASDKNIMEKAKEYKFYDFIKKMPDGFQTIVGGGGHNISRGEKQRIALFAILLKEPEILILDEATNSIDPMNESFFNSFLDGFSQNHIVLAITHNHSKIRHYNEIFLISDKCISMNGTYWELAANSKKFNQLVER